MSSPIELYTNLLKLVKPVKLHNDFTRYNRWATWVAEASMDTIGDGARILSGLKKENPDLPIEVWTYVAKTAVKLRRQLLEEMEDDFEESSWEKYGQAQWQQYNERYCA